MFETMAGFQIPTLFHAAGKKSEHPHLPHASPLLDNDTHDEWQDMH